MNFNRKSSYDRHVNRKFPCKLVEDDKVLVANKSEVMMERLIKKMEELAEDNKSLKHEVRQLRAMNNMEIAGDNSGNNASNNTNTNSNNNTNTNSNNMFIVNINKFGDEKDDHLTQAEKNRIMNRGYNSIPEYVKAIHFNQRAPENHNVYLPNWRDKNKLLMYNGDDWVLEDKDTIIDDLKTKGIDFIHKKYKDLNRKNKIDAVIMKKLDRFLDSYENEEKDKMITLNEEILLVLYNGRKMVERTRKGKAKVTKDGDDDDDYGYDIDDIDDVESKQNIVSLVTKDDEPKKTKISKKIIRY